MKKKNSSRHPIERKRNHKIQIDSTSTTPTTLRTSPKVRSRNLSPSGFVTTSNTNVVNSEQESLTSQKLYLSVIVANIMAGNDIKFPIFNGNGLEDPEEHCFLCEAIWTVRHVQDEPIKQAQMITTLRGHALY